MAITRCTICNTDLTLFHANHGICPLCRNETVRKAVEQGAIDWQHIETRMIQTMAARVVTLLNACATVKDAYYMLHDHEHHQGGRYQAPVIYATITIGLGEVGVVIQDSHILTILAQDLRGLKDLRV